MTVVDVVVGRQPVFDRDLLVVGYELFFRPVDGGDRAPLSVDGDLMTSTVLFSSVAIGLERLVEGKMAFCNVDRGLLMGTVPMVLGPQQAVIEVQSSLGADDRVVTGCRRLAADGYLLAVDDYLGEEESERLLRLASLVKIDLQLAAPDQLAGLVASCRPHGVLVVAERVEIPEQFARCKELGFDYFQGHLLSRPRRVPGRALPLFNPERVRAAAALLQRGGSAIQAVEVVRTEPALAHRLLQMAGAESGREVVRGVRSLREALVRVGSHRLQEWVRLVLGTHQEPAAEEEVTSTLTRARMCELLAGAQSPKLAELAYTAGLLSCLDRLLGTSIGEVLSGLPLDLELYEAAARRSTPIGLLVQDVVDFQGGRTARAVRSGFDQGTLSAAAAAAFAWAVEGATGEPAPVLAG